MQIKIDLSHRIYRCQNGIRLVNPTEATLLPDNNYGQATPHTVSSVLALPFNFFFLNTQGQTELMNDECALICGFQSAADSIGKSLYDVSEKESAKDLIDNCTEVIKSKTVGIFEEENLRNDGTSLEFLTIKCPWYDERAQVIGVFGCSIVLGKHKLASSLSAVIQLGLFDSEQLPMKGTNNLNINKNYLSKREMDCLQLTIKGYTAKRIGRELGISHRTVEEYLVNLRMKMGASSKAELIEMTIDQFIS
ncbi:response regulator FixJ [Legionella massiliensis]|uniref:Response regulator FixJ n=1 Tax=Legionella massiliensis TaxID=1034943 RepID=A0A078KPY5_9GAMM|nr:LuxR C-terminal-related transcriptional regulator [Legionella massiliensis]CDZ76420.1 response regulator FixJ [Legionella massiliensis]CEE12158.1 response regulator FixJ [Legionella massiliensis]